jgi:uncharacterized protein YndB with AHSA1/START domain
MRYNFQPVVGHGFSFRSPPMPQWNGVTDCKLLLVDPHRTLCYSWNSSGAETAAGLTTAVTWALTPTPSGTLVRMQQAEFRVENENFYRGAGHGWPKMVVAPEQVAARAD